MIHAGDRHIRVISEYEFSLVDLGIIAQAECGPHQKAIFSGQKFSS